jgi:hypothetical protein
MSTLVCIMLGFSSVSGLMLISDWIRTHRPSMFLGQSDLRVRVNAPEWALQELQFVSAAERLMQVEASVLPHARLSGDLRPQRCAEAA